MVLCDLKEYLSTHQRKNRDFQLPDPEQLNINKADLNQKISTVDDRKPINYQYEEETEEMVTNILAND